MKQGDYSHSMSAIGSMQPQRVMYLPNPPSVSESFNPQAPDLPQLIADNGNHWRKIITILAKLCCQGDNWKGYRDNQMFNEKEQLCFTNKLVEEAQWHFICGKVTWQQMGYDHYQFTPINEDQTAFIDGNLLLLPYPDYRQFPNRLIAQVVGIMQQPC